MKSNTKFVELSHHLLQRSQRRGISSATIQLIARYGYRQHAGGGRFKRIIRSRDGVQLARNKIAVPKEVEKAYGVLIITMEKGLNVITVVTVYPRVKEKWPQARWKKHRFKGKISRIPLAVRVDQVLQAS